LDGSPDSRFITEGIHAALEQATAAAGGRDVRLGGGVSTIRQYLRAGLIDELHLAVRPVLQIRKAALSREVAADGSLARSVLDKRGGIFQEWRRSLAATQSRE